MGVTYDELVQRLREEHERITKRVEQFRSDASQSREMREGSPFGKKDDEATKAAEFEKRLALEEGLKRLLGEMKHALSKSDEGTYGLCDICGQSIGIDRLEALPQAHLCLSCKAHETRSAKGKFLPK